MWKEAAGLELHPQNFPWDKFPWQKAIFHFARLLGAVHTDNINLARTELKNLYASYDTLVKLKDTYKANQVMIQIKTGEAWILFAERKLTEAVQLMNIAAGMEDKTEKSPVTPGEVLPAKELLADMLLQLNKPAEALKAYEEDLKKHPNRFNGLYGAAVASKKTSNVQKESFYFKQLIATANSADSNKPELEIARSFLKKENR